MGIPPHYKVCSSGEEETPQHCLLDCPMAQKAWKAFKRIWNHRDLAITWSFVLLGEATAELDDDTPGLFTYNTGGFTYPRQPLDIF